MLAKTTLFQGTRLINQSFVSTIFVANFPDAPVRTTSRAAQQLPGPIQLDKDIDNTRTHAPGSGFRTYCQDVSFYRQILNLDIRNNVKRYGLG